MAPSISDHCRDCVRNLQRVISTWSQSDCRDDLIKKNEVNDDLDRLNLFVGDIGGLHNPESPMSVESRLSGAKDVLTHILSLLSDLNEAAEDLLDIVAGDAQSLPCAIEDSREENIQDISETCELQKEIKGTITRLLRAKTLIRQAKPSDNFAKALSRKRYHIDNQFDIAHVGEKHRKLAANDRIWLRQRLGRAITHRRQVLSYNRDHHEQLDGHGNDRTEEPQVSTTDQPMSNPTLFTKATTFIPERIDPSLLHAGEPDSEDDVLSYTTISRSVDGNGEASTTLRIPKLDNLRIGNSREFSCPFCFRIQRCKNDRVWRNHIFSDIRPYVCTFPNCDAPYYGDINAWFQHEISCHRVVYKCFICSDATSYSEKTYVAHLKERHAKILDNAEGELEMSLARKPLTEIPAKDCPCCTEWVDRLKEREVLAGTPILNGTLTVNPTVFKRHLANHLEQLALFALPTITATDASDESNDAIELESDRIALSSNSALTFSSSPQVPEQSESVESLPAHEQPTNVDHNTPQKVSSADSDQNVAQMPDPAPTQFRSLTGAIQGTPHAGWYDLLDSSYRMRTSSEAESFFIPGRVFAMLYSETASETSHPHASDQAYTVVRFNERVHTNIRRFVVLQDNHGFVYACPIGTYAGRGTLKKGCFPWEHAIVYLSGTDPGTCYLPGEYEGGMVKQPIEIIPVDASIRLRPESRIRFGKMYPIEKNVKVKDIGQVHPSHLSKLLKYWTDGYTAQS